MNEEERLWILLAEDHERDARPLREFFKFKGLECKHSYTAGDALKGVQKDIHNPPFMMILDVLLPSQREGIDVAKEIWNLQQKHQLNPTFALFISVVSEDNFEAEFKVLTQHFQHIFPNHPKQWQYVQKPIDFVQLDAIVSRIIKISQEED